jgi:hypothetical protein
MTQSRSGKDLAAAQDHSKSQRSEDIEAVLGREIEPIVGPSIAPDAVRQITNVERRTEFFSGPLPPPSQLSAYEQIFPGFAERIMAMAEKEQSNRHGMQALQAERHSQSEKLGLRGFPYSWRMSLCLFP